MIINESGVCVQLGDVHLYVVRVGHLEQQLQGLALQCLVWVFQAVDHRQLVVGGKAGVDAHNPAEGLDSHILEIVVGRF